MNFGGKNKKSINVTCSHSAFSFFALNAIAQNATKETMQLKGHFVDTKMKKDLAGKTAT